jgi:uncharacterized protein DUF5985
MTINFASAVYLLCFLTSLAAMLLLVRSFSHNRSPLLLWSAASFVAFAVNNLLLFVDIVLLPDVDLRPARAATGLLAVALLLYGFIWEID